MEGAVETPRVPLKNLSCEGRKTGLKLRENVLGNEWESQCERRASIWHNWERFNQLFCNARTQCILMQQIFVHAAQA